MTRIAAHTITIPAETTTIAIEAWDTEDGATQGIIWDRTGQEDQDGEWGTQLIDWEGDLDDITARLTSAGFTVGDFTTENLGDGDEQFATATR